MLIKNLLIVGTGFFLVTGCTTLSDDAPAELHSAKTSLDEAYDKDVDDALPNTMARSESSFEDGVRLYGESKDYQSEGDTDMAADARKEAIEKANQSKKLSTTAIALNDDVKAWDQDIDIYAQIKNDANSSEELQKQIAALEANQGVISDDFNVVKPVAFFMTDNANLNQSFENDVDTLVLLLNKHKALYVELTGFADHRGPDAYNKKLAMQRAQAVAKILRDKGITQERIKLTSLGSDLAASDTSNPARLQLDRRVEAKLTVLSH